MIVRPDGSLSAVHSGGTVDGFEATIKNTLLFAYYGGIYIGRDAALDANGKSLIGYGYRARPTAKTEPSRKLPLASIRRFGRIRAMVLSM